MTHPRHKELKRAAECAVGPNKPASNGKRMNTRQAMDSYGSRASTRLRHHPLTPNQYRGGEPWVRGKRRYGLVMGRKGKPGFPLKLFWGNVLLG